MFSHVLSSYIPDGEQDALTFVVAGAILVWLTKVAQRDGAINC